MDVRGVCVCVFVRSDFVIMNADTFPKPCPLFDYLASILMSRIVSSYWGFSYIGHTANESIP